MEIKFISERITNISLLEKILERERILISLIEKELEKNQFDNRKVKGILRQLSNTNEKARNFEFCLEQREVKMKDRISGD